MSSIQQPDPLTVPRAPGALPTDLPRTAADPERDTRTHHRFTGEGPSFAELESEPDPYVELPIQSEAAVLAPRPAGHACATCGNEYDKAFQVIKDGRTYWFDSFECAAQALAPRCAHCSLRILGHGLEDDGRFFCCAHCASMRGTTVLRDRA